MERNSLPADARVRDARAYSFRDLRAMLKRRRRFLGFTVVGLNLLCLLYCLIAPNRYEASAKIALRMQPVSTLTVDAPEVFSPASFLSTPLQLETLAGVLRSERLAWRVILSQKLYQSAAFSRKFAARFPGFDVARPSPEAVSYLLDSFGKSLHVRVLPRTLLIEIRFRSKDAAQSAAVVNALIDAYRDQESEGRVDATAEAAGWLAGQVKALTAQVEAKEKRLAEFEREHGFMTVQQTETGGQPVETLHDTSIQQVDEAERMLTEASGQRIVRESLYMQARQGNPEQVLAANPELQAEMGSGGATMAQQLRTHLSEVNVELAQLKAEHGPNYPRVVELMRAAQEIDAQVQAEDANLVEAFERTWKAAQAREQLLKQQLDTRMEQGTRQNDATIQYSVLHQVVLSGRLLCNRLQQRIEDARLSAGVRSSAITVVDEARTPVKPVAPDMPLYLAISLFTSLWLALGGGLLLDALEQEDMRFGEMGGLRKIKASAPALILLLLWASLGMAQAPTPNTQGLPTGVVKLPLDEPATVHPDAKSAPPVWNGAAETPTQGLPEPARFAGAAMALPIEVGDFLDVSEFHTPEFRSSVRVAADGTVMLPLVGQVKVTGMTEQQAGAAIENALVAAGMLLHPQVSVLVTNAVGQDVSVMGEVARPGVYPYTVHHRLLDLIAAASGLTANAGRLVSVFHRDEPRTAHAVVLDPTGTGASGFGATGTVRVVTTKTPEVGAEPNPELEPGDTVLVSRAGLVYVIGDVVRPGGFAVDPVQGLTVVQALSLAWGATPNASAAKAILIRDQAGGRTLTTLNLRRMIRGQDPDQPVRDRDILFVPDSTAKNLMNKSLEAAIQSAIGVSIYAGLVYSQRF
jgi:polysaccharide export outer membrane protein